MFIRARMGFVLALTVAALTAPSASAESVEVSQEAGGGDTHCTSVALNDHIPSGGCSFRFVSEGQTETFVHSGLMELLWGHVCNWEVEARVDETGAGYWYGYQLFPEHPECGFEVCDEGEPSAHPHRDLARPFQLTADAAGNVTMALTLCLVTHSSDPESEGRHGAACSLELAVTQAGEHAYEFSTPPEGATTCLPSLEFHAHWITEPNQDHPDDIEIAVVE